MRDFLKANRAELDAMIRNACPNARINDSERAMWVMNDETLYRMARRAGARI
jgi:predicted transcriptional regulator